MRTDRVGLGIGLFFVAAGVLFLLEGLDVVRVRAAWVWPLLLIGFGVALVAGGVRRAAREPSPAPPAEGPPPPRGASMGDEPPTEPGGRTEDEDEGEPGREA